MILNEEDRNAIEDGCEMMIGKTAFDAIEAAVLSKLCAMEMPEPVAIVAKSAMRVDIGWVTEVPHNTKLYTADQLRTAIAAARVQALDDAADIVDNAVTPDCGGWTASGIAETVRALKGGAA